MTKKKSSKKNKIDIMPAGDGPTIKTISYKPEMSDVVLRMLRWEDAGLVRFHSLLCPDGLIDNEVMQFSVSTANSAIVTDFVVTADSGVFTICQIHRQFSQTLVGNLADLFDLVSSLESLLGIELKAGE